MRKQNGHDEKERGRSLAHLAQMSFLNRNGNFGTKGEEIPPPSEADEGNRLTVTLVPWFADRMHINMCMCVRIYLCSTRMKKGASGEHMSLDVVKNI